MWTHEVRDIADSSELDNREGIELGLIRIKVDTLHRINEALSRLHHGTYDTRERFFAPVSEQADWRAL